MNGPLFVWSLHRSTEINVNPGRNLPTPKTKQLLGQNSPNPRAETHKILRRTWLKTLQNKPEIARKKAHILDLFTHCSCALCMLTVHDSYIV